MHDTQAPPARQRAGSGHVIRRKPSPRTSKRRKPPADRLRRARLRWAVRTLGKALAVAAEHGTDAAFIAWLKAELRRRRRSRK